MTYADVKINRRDEGEEMNHTKAIKVPVVVGCVSFIHKKKKKRAN